jgi:type II secretory ATPase GspE/PulE/Tfp pilus assembly ATPase PilB-like protein
MQAAALRLPLGGKEPEVVVPELVEHAARARASDLYFNSNEDNVEVSIRHLGLIRHIGTLAADIGRRCISFVKTQGDMNVSERRRPLDGRWLFNGKEGRRLDLRINTIPTLYGEDCTLRILDQQYRLLEIGQLGMPQSIQVDLTRALSAPNGLILVTGPTEAGKTTTLYACLNHLNTGDRKISTIEDPIEYSLRGVRQSQVNAAIELGFDDLLRGVLRQAPDVIMIGEVRDAETARTAVWAAATGHMVLTTLHAPVATAAVHTLLRLDVNAHLLANALLVVLSQRLLRALCPACRQQFEVPSPALFAGVRAEMAPSEGKHLYGPKGCNECLMTGYGTRTGIFEMLRVSPEVRRLIDDRASMQAIRARAAQESMVEFRHSALLKLAQGETSLEEVVRVLPIEFLGEAKQPAPGAITTPPLAD